MTHHGEVLRRLIKDDALLAQLKEDYTLASLPPADRAMLDYAAKLTLTPAKVTRQDVQTLRDAGFDDRAILDIAQITAYFAFVNRTTDGLGVTIEDYWEKAQ
jgi:uncharacterized peroxidase-related enzyme